MVVKTPIKFFLDHCVPDSVGRALESVGHEVIYLREKLAADAADPIVAAVAEMHGAVLVTHDTDFKTLAPRIGAGAKRFRRLSRIGLRCAEPNSARRIVDALSLIEHEWERAQQTNDPRMIVEIAETVIRTIR